MARRTAAARRGGRLAARLFAAQASIVGAGGTTLVIVVMVIAPGLFRVLVRRTVGPVPADLGHQLDRAFAKALLLSLGDAAVAALVTALAVGWFMNRRLTRPVAAMATAATLIADGDHDARLPASRLGVEFDLLGNAFNRMAAALQGTERSRRELVADLTRELRAPIAALDSFLEGIEDGVIPTTMESWHTMRIQTARLRRLVDDVDTISRAEERHLDAHARPVNVDDVVAEAIRATAAAFHEKHVSLRHRPNPTPAHIRADPERFREVLDHLLFNALRHTPSGGAVTVSTATDRAHVVVRVDDSGEGIAAEHLPRVFDRFYQADPARGRTTGTGIGLTIARAFARAHGGDLQAASGGRGQGASFTLTLPAAPNT